MQDTEDLSKSVLEAITSRSKAIEAENALLKQDIQKLSSSSQISALNYYIRLRGDLYFELQRLTKKNEESDLEKDQIEKALTTELEQTKSKLQETEADYESLKSDYEKLQADMEEKNQLLERRTNVPLKSNPNGEKVGYLEEQVNALTSELSKKEYLIKDQKDMIDELQVQIDSQQKELSEQINNWKAQYEALLGPAQTIEENFREIFEGKNETYRKNMEDNKYLMERKILHTEEVLNKKEEEIVAIKEKYEKILQERENEILNLKNSYKDLHTNYEIIYTGTQNHLQSLQELMQKLKNLYMQREQEFLSTANYYVEAINGYNKALFDIKNANTNMEEDFHKNTSQLVNLQTENENLRKELLLEKEQNQKNIENFKKTCEENEREMNEKIIGLTNSQGQIREKLKKINKIYDDFTKSNLLSHLTKENQEYKEKIENLKLTNDNLLEDKRKFESEITVKTEKLEKLQNDYRMKEEELNNFRVMFSKEMDKIEPQNVSPEQGKLLTQQIKNMKTQQEKLLLTKDNMETYYQNKVKDLENRLKIEEDRQNEEKNEESINQADYGDLYNQEVQRVIEAEASFNQLSALLIDFKKIYDELKEAIKSNKDKEVNQLKRELEEKNTQLRQSKKLSSDKKTKKQPGDDMKNIFKQKVTLYQSLVEKKESEVNALKTHSKLFKELTDNVQRMVTEEKNNFAQIKSHFNDVLNELKEHKEKYAESLKNEIVDLQNKLKQCNEIRQKNIEEIKNAGDEQLKLIKEREVYMTKQAEMTRNNLAAELEEKEKMIETLRDENQQLRQKNFLLNKKI